MNIWYGNEQHFHGTPQRWINILGRVYDVESLRYRLNDGPVVSLSIGQDQRRLVGIGDFNIDLDIRQVKPGRNTVTITADDHTETVIVYYDPDPPVLPYTVDWSAVDRIQDVAQAVDGQWVISGDTVSPTEIGYDRLIAIGDMSWKDYEVTVPITVHGINSGCYAFPSVHAGVGLVMRWRGHTNWGRDSWASGQPYFGPSPYGAIGWYCVFHETGPELNFFDPDFNRPVRQPFSLPLHIPHMFKVRVQGNHYSLKVWPDGTSEPSEWNISADGTVMSLESGSFLLGAHHVACQFGRVEVRAL